MAIPVIRAKCLRRFRHPTPRSSRLQKHNPNDPLLKHIMIMMLDKLPKVKVLPYEGVEMIRIRYAAAQGVEKSILGDVLRLLEVGVDG